jgi:hypothetical protein
VAGAFCHANPDRSEMPWICVNRALKIVILSASDKDARSKIPAPAGKNLNLNAGEKSADEMRVPHPSLLRVRVFLFALECS